MRRSWRASGLAAALGVVVGAVGGGGTEARVPIDPQAPRFRVAYDVAAVRAFGGVRQAIAAGRVSGPPETDLRLSVHTDSAEVEALFELVPEGDSVTLAGEFFTRRRLGRSRRGLGLWEHDSYRRHVRLAWAGEGGEEAGGGGRGGGDTARIFPFGPPRRGAAESLWVEVVVTREFAGGETRPTETLVVMDSSPVLTLEAVVRPRRARVVLALVRNDSVSAPRGLDLVPEGAPRRLELVLGRGPARSLEVGLARPEPARAGRDRALALDADIVCLRVTPRETAYPVGVLCGRLNNVARRLPLGGGDTLVATFAWPPAR